MKNIISLVLLSCFSVVFSQENGRSYNLIIAFDSSMDIDRKNAVSELALSVEGFRDVLNKYNFDLRYSFVFSEEKLQQMEQQALRVSGNSESVRNLRNVFDVINADLTDGDLQNLSEDLQKLPRVTYVELIDAKPVPPPYDIPPITPNYVPQQTYINANPGVNMQYAWDMDLNAQGIRIRNIEYEFNKNHEEFHANPKIQLASGYTINPSLYTPDYSDFLDHGTGTFGVVFGDDGGYGVKGLAYGAEEVILYPEWTTQFGYNRPYAVSLALDNSQEGDVVIYEMQTGGASGVSGDYVPAEYSSSIWDLTKAASDLGIIIVAAAGNGNQNLDALEYFDYMNKGNSGAIIVGAGTPNVFHDRLYYPNWWGSTYGSRVNLQGWGEGVLSSGYGDYATIGGDYNQRYIMFSGTSSATPIVASCVAVLQSYYHSLTGEYLDSAEMIDILQITGIPQGTGVMGNIGPLPNMEAAIAYVQTLTRVDISQKPSFTIYPNPFDNRINIIGFNNPTNVKAELYNAVGQKVMESDFSDQTIISAGHLQTGMYFLKLTENGKTITYKVVKK